MLILKPRNVLAGSVLFARFAAGALAQSSECAEAKKSPIAVQRSVASCLATAIANTGSFCGTPRAMACEPVIDAGGDAVPVLLAVIRDGNDARMIPTARGLLSEITCKPLKSSAEALDDLEDFSRWWLSNCGRDRSEWIVDALVSSDPEAVRLGLTQIRRIKRESETPRLIPLLESPNLYLGRTVLGLLWTQFHSATAIEKAAALMEIPGRRSDAFVYQVVESKIEPLYPVILCLLRKASVGRELPDGLIDAAGKLKLSGAVELLKEWERDRGITASKATLISTLTELDPGYQETRLVGYLRSENRSERFQAAVALGKVGEPRRTFGELLTALRADDLDGAAAGAMWGLLSLSERGLIAADLAGAAAAILKAFRGNTTLEAAKVNRVVSDLAYRYQRAVGGDTSEVPRLGYSSDTKVVLERWGKWWSEQRPPDSPR